MSQERETVNGSLRISRRKFLGGTALLALATLVGIRSDDIQHSFLQISHLDQLLGFRVLPSQIGIEPSLAGITPNHPWLWEYIDSQERVDKEIEKVKKMPTSMIRIFLDDRIEPKLGQYRFDLLDKVARLSEKINLQVDLFDAFNLLHSDKPSASYVAYEPTSPYLGVKEGRLLQERKSAFFKDPQIIEAFHRRVATFVGYLRGVGGIKVWSVGNEFEAPPDILTAWYAQVLTVLREVDPERPMIAGVANPTLLDEQQLHPLGLTANTIHVYPDLVGNSLERIMSRYFTNHKRVLPLICQEIGVPRLPGEIAFDWLYSQFLNRTLLSFVEINQPDGWIRPTVSGLGLWRLSSGSEKSDGHEINPDELPKTMGIIWTWDEIMRRATVPASNAA